MNSAATYGVGLVVLNYNNSKETIRFLETIRSNRALKAVQVVDNCSTDNSRDILENYCSNARDCRLGLTISPSNIGYGRGNNLGVAQLLSRASCDYVIISNPDVIFNENTVHELVYFLDAHPDYAAAAPIMKTPKGATCQSGWRLPTKHLLIKDAIRYFLPILPDPYDYGTGINTTSSFSQVEVLPGSFFLIRVDVFNSVNGFDEDTFLYGEENLLFAKVRASGWKCCIVNSLSYIHAHGTSINKEFASVKKRYWMLRSSNITYCRKVLHTSKTWVVFYKCLYTASIEVFTIELGIKNIIQSKKLQKKTSKKRK